MVTIDYGTEVWKLAFSLKLVDKGIVALMGIVGTAYIDAYICHTGNELSIGNDADRGGIEDNIIEIFL